MKNLKKVLALALVFAMALTLFAGAAFSDQDKIGTDYTDDVNMLSELGVISGYTDGTFRPEGNITRAEFSKMAYTLKYGSDDQGKLFVGQKSGFTDVEGQSAVAWAKGYINYCENQKIVAGVGYGKFNPNGNVTVAEAAKMLLVILGCDPVKEGLVGSNWQGNTVSKAMTLGVFDGWVGDPTQPASRQLIAKLMRNTIFAPVYIYSPITGVGSQNSILDPSIENETLGEQTMGMKHESGIVVANERYAISTDEEGDAYTLPIKVQAEDKAQVVYEDKDGDDALLTIDRAMDDATLGTLVDVYFKAEGKSGNYSKVEVIGSVLKSAKTIVYDVATRDLKMMPDGESTKTSEIKPYIEFTTADGTSVKINAPAGTDRVAQNVDYDGAAFTDLMYFSTSTAKNMNTGMLDQPAAGDKMIDEMGKDTVGSYRLVSVDGGATISYIFKTQNITKGTVSSYSESKGTVSSSAIGGTKDLEDVVVYEGIKREDTVLAYEENGKAVLLPTTTVTGSATTWSKNKAVINGSDYYGDVNFFLNDIGYGSMAAYYASAEGKTTARANTTYIVYNNIILEIGEKSNEASDLGDYGVILTSTYDAVTGEASVKIGTSTGSEATYDVKTINGYDSDDDTEYGGFADLQDNGLLGYIVTYTENSGKVDFDVEEKAETSSQPYKITSNSIKTKNGTMYADENSVMFFLYNSSATARTVKAKVYNLIDLNDQSSLAVNYKFTTAGAAVAQHYINGIKKSSNNSELLVGVMSMGTTTPTITSKTDEIGYIVEAVVNYDSDTRKNYLDVTLVGNDGLHVGSFKDVKTADISGFYPGDTCTGNNKFARGNIANYKLSGTDAFSAVDVDQGQIANQEVRINTAATVANGFYKVNVSNLTSTRVEFYAWNDTAALVGSRIDTANLQSMQLDEDDFKAIGIQDDEYLGEDVEEISQNEAVLAGTYNAIVQVDNNKVLRIFSIHGLND